MGRARWFPRSLRWRLAVWVAAVMIVSSGTVFVVVYVNTGTQVQHEIEQDIRDDTGQLAHLLQAVRNPTPQTLAATASGYVSSQPYNGTSTLYFVLIPGQAPVTNEPDVFSGPRGRRHRPVRLRPTALGAPRIGYQTRRVVNVGPMRILERFVDIGSFHTLVGAGEPLSSVSKAQSGVARAFVLAGAVSIALALIASYFAGARVTAPLRRMAAVAARVDAGDLEPRMEAQPGSGEEVRVLADAFNRMLDRLAEAFAGQREFVADASHELRTPLTVIRGQLELLAASADPGPEEIAHVDRVVQGEIVRISRLVDDLLLLAQAEQTDFLRSESIDLASFVGELWDGMSLTAERRFELGEVPSGRLRADPDRVAQALRNLGRNAVEHTAPGSGLVRLDVEPLPGGRVRFAISDNGPGIAPGQRELVFDRFHRTDPARSRAAGGAGLGLAIVRAIAEAHHGTVRATEAGSARGLTGARIELVLPGYSPR
ncbi:MAG: sensor histidine kinase [Solirubrobacteraceae bacterium]